MNAAARLCIVASAALLSACGTFGGTESSKFRAEPIVRQAKFEGLDLIAELSKKTPEKPSADMTDVEYSAALEGALRNFNAEWGQGAVAQRNLILDRIVLASVQSCEQYKTTLLRKQSYPNFWLGVAGVVAGAAGAVMTGAQAASNLSATSAVTSGIRAEFNQDFFADQAANSLTRAIDKRRTEMITREFAEARKASIEDYSVQLAIADGAMFHGVCSLIGAMQYADHAIATLDADKGPKVTAASAFMPKPKQ